MNKSLEAIVKTNIQSERSTSVERILPMSRRVKQPAEAVMFEIVRITTNN